MLGKLLGTTPSKSKEVNMVNSAARHSTLTYNTPLVAHGIPFWQWRWKSAARYSLCTARYSCSAMRHCQASKCWHWLSSFMMISCGPQFLSRQQVYLVITHILLPIKRQSGSMEKNNEEHHVKPPLNSAKILSHLIPNYYFHKSVHNHSHTLSKQIQLKTRNSRYPVLSLNRVSTLIHSVEPRIKQPYCYNQSKVEV